MPPPYTVSPSRAKVKEPPSCVNVPAVVASPNCSDFPGKVMLAPYFPVRKTRPSLTTKSSAELTASPVVPTVPSAVFQYCITVHAAGLSAWALLAMSLLSCYLLNAEIPFFSFKFHDFSWKNHSTQYLFLIGALVLIIFCVAKAIACRHIGLTVFAGAACVLWYVALNLLLWIAKR